MRTKVFARLGAWCVVGAVVAGMGIQAAEATPWSSDFDADSDVDLEDFSGFAACFNGPNRSPSTFCAVDADLDDDTDVDLADFSVFAACFNGPNRTPACEGDLLTVNIETVPVGNPGNAGEWSGQSYGGCGPDRVCGAVDYTYNIGKYEVTAGQYTAFLNKVAATDAYGLYNTNMWSSSYGCKIQR
ncbi:MAG: hypothetical protein JXA69_06125, partial [Phycisphaerae bacterium]|nr:hypothetical protein [Phycisphaerae bacterium]